VTFILIVATYVYIDQVCRAVSEYPGSIEVWKRTIEQSIAAIAFELEARSLILVTTS
jgi:hypothetical protein